ncbi:Wzz/FepE/Etk N-terminal domain-containing protein [Mitsuokella multacida]|uniref:Wzz/FepE/Etk N-terminal domain-containing protein n=1 Tax=Mitsuokella multacida TaxID=52226 RepID=UPI0026E06A03|nr:Wzz/FepE/Etk N-terminal domain-containing protein [Mitsuokella multacida]
MDLEKEESIDLGKLWQVTKAHKKVVGGIIVGCTAIATITAFVLPKQYESTTLVQTRSASKEMGGQAAAMLAAATGTSTASPTNNYMELMKTRTVLDPIIDELYEGKDPRQEAGRRRLCQVKPRHQEHQGYEPHHCHCQRQDTRRGPADLPGSRR